MQILENDDQIKAAIATMNPVARAAAQNLAHHFTHNSNDFEDDVKRQRAFFGSCQFAMQQAGWDMQDQTRIGRFLEDHSDAIVNVAVSILKNNATKADQTKSSEDEAGCFGVVIGIIVGIILAGLGG